VYALWGVVSPRVTQTRRNLDLCGNKFEEELDLAMEDEQIDNSPGW